MKGIAEWLASIGLSEYAQRFADNAIDVSVVRDLTQDFKDLDRRVRSRQGRSSPYAVRSEADDVGRSIPTDVGQLARIGVVAVPTAGVGPEGGKLERGHRKVPGCGGQGYVDTGRAEADDVGFAVPIYVCQRARVGVVAAPAAGHGTEGGKLECGHRKVPACG